MEKVEGIVDGAGRLRDCCGSGGAVSGECSWFDVSVLLDHMLEILSGKGTGMAQSA